MHLLLYGTLLDLVELHVESRPQLLQLDVLSCAFPAPGLRSRRLVQLVAGGAAPVQVVAELYAFAAVGEGHDALAFSFGHGKDVLQNGCRALAEAAAPAGEKTSVS